MENFKESDSFQAEVEKTKKEAIDQIFSTKIDAIKEVTKNFTDTMLKATKEGFSEKQYFELFDVALEEMQKTLDVINKAEEQALKNIEKGPTDIKPLAV